jgi:hypothetical protein
VLSIWFLSIRRFPSAPPPNALQPILLSGNESQTLPPGLGISEAPLGRQALRRCERQRSLVGYMAGGPTEATGVGRKLPRRALTAATKSAGRAYCFC